MHENLSCFFWSHDPLISIIETIILNGMVERLIYKEISGMIKYVSSILHKGALYKTPVRVKYIED